MPKFQSNKILIIAILLAIAISAISFFDAVLAVGLVLPLLLASGTVFAVFKLGIGSRPLLALVLTAFAIHLLAVLFIHYANFQPFSGGDGDYRLYNDTAKVISERLHQGNFSLKGKEVFAPHIYPVIIGYVYALTVSDMFVGQLLNVWLAMISALLSFLIVLEINGSKKQAFFVGLVASLYPSYLFFGSLLLKDALVVPLALAALFLILRLVKNFSWRVFLFFYIVLGFLVHFRFYVGYALAVTFVLCWWALYKLDFAKKIRIVAVIVIFLGLLPYFAGQGIFGYQSLSYYLKPRMIVSYREEAYVPPPAVEIPKAEPPANEPKPQEQKSENEFSKIVDAVKFSTNTIIKGVFVNIEKPSNRQSSSTIAVKTEINKPLKFIINWVESFIYTLFGPLPWQIQSYAQLFVLLEIIPWYFLLFFIIRGCAEAVKHNRTALPLLVFSIVVFGVLALFIPNFGVTARIRIPAFISLCCLIPLGLGKFADFKIPFVEKIFT